VSSTDPSRRAILVVDDELGVRRFACQVLEREGYRTVEANGGRDALALLSADPSRVALVLSDIRMPGMNGLQLEQAIHDEWPELPVILMSGEATREWVVRLVRDAPLRVLRKPFEREELLVRVRELLGDRSPSNETPEAG
jgi:DNA-binding NtrC family response regulator